MKRLMILVGLQALGAIGIVLNAIAIVLNASQNPLVSVICGIAMIGSIYTTAMFSYELCKELLNDV